MKFVVVLMTAMLSVSAVRALPVEINDNFLKVSSVDLAIQLMPQAVYSPKVLKFYFDAGMGVSAGVFGMQMTDQKCSVSVAWTSEDLCSSTANCNIKGFFIGIPSCDFNSPYMLSSLKRALTNPSIQYKLAQTCGIYNGRASCIRQWIK